MAAYLFTPCHFIYFTLQKAFDATTPTPYIDTAVNILISICLQKTSMLKLYCGSRANMIFVEIDFLKNMFENYIKNHF